MSTDTALAVAGIALTIIFGIWGGKAIKERRNKQSQKATNGSIAIQSGRDTKIGKSE